MPQTKMIQRKAGTFIITARSNGDKQLVSVSKNEKLIHEQPGELTSDSPVTPFDVVVSDVESGRYDSAEN